ncbi:DUF4230 domain-containing protein [Flagellimonas sp. HMM57]|uniref:DUF4230 domain-containing protein n=1 Tax=unclassified Flagellimonas TaxID=2644544 RepID=UPI0013D5763A|nr:MULTISPECIES: DUF4230 domain-containing protein [unclassified Flagellimonas]UII74810.1 DUF4230 domain-containing protein [Flagellimonas sp. HMM57]
MKKVLFGALIALASVLIYKSCTDDREEKAILRENSLLIQEELKNVSKLIVTEGHFAEVYNYKDSKALFGSLISADKRALVVVNAEVAIAYDLSQVDYEIEETEKTIYIKSIPEPEIKINPDFEYYDVSADYLNPFSANDYNKIKNTVKSSLLKKIETSSLKSNAENRLVSELSKLYVLTNSLGWKLVYNQKQIDSSTQLEAMGKTMVD